MTKWILIIAFNIVFGLMAGYITTLVFGSKESLDTGNKEREWKENKKMILIITLASVVSGIFWYSLLGKQAKWYLTGILFGFTVTLLTPMIMRLSDLWEDLSLRPKPGVILDSKIKFLSEFYRSIDLMEIIVISGFTLLYGIFSLLTPILGLLWAYLMYKFVMRIE